MYEAFYGFREKPFSLLPDPDYLYLSEQHQMAMTLLEYSLENQAGFCVISGNIGTGKTTLIRYLLNRIGNDISVGLISNTHQSFGELLRWILHAFNLESAGKSKAEMHQAFSDYLIAQYAKNRRTMIIVDEAQNMSPAALEELRMLSNINSEKDLVLQVILVGQPGLRELLQRPELEQLTQRVAVDYHLKPLGGAETRAYIRHRVAVVGGDPQLFSDGACDAVFHYSGGTPRLINLLCDLVLVYAYAEQIMAVSRDLVDQVVRERQAHGVLPIFTVGAPPPERPAEVDATSRSSVASRLSPAAPAPRAEIPADAIPVDSRMPGAPTASGAVPTTNSAGAASVTPVDAVRAEVAVQTETTTAAPAIPDASPEPVVPPQDIPTAVAGGSADATPAPPGATDSASGQSDVVDSMLAASVPARRARRWWIAGIAASAVLSGAVAAWLLYSEAPTSVKQNAVAMPAPSPVPVENAATSSSTAADPQTGQTLPVGSTPGAAAVPNPAPPPPISTQEPPHDAPTTTARPGEGERHAVPVVTRRPPARDTARHRDASAAKVRAPARVEPASAPVSSAAEMPAIKTVAEAAPVPVVAAPVVEAPVSKPSISVPRAEDGRSAVSAKTTAEPATEFAADPCKGAAARFLSTCK